MYGGGLLTQFQVSIFIFEGLPTDSTLLQSLKQNSNLSAHSGRNFELFSYQDYKKIFYLRQCLYLRKLPEKEFRLLSLTVVKLQDSKFYQSLKQNVQLSAHSGRMMLRLYLECPIHLLRYPLTQFYVWDLYPKYSHVLH